MQLRAKVLFLCSCFFLLGSLSARSFDTSEFIRKTELARDLQTQNPDSAFILGRELRSLAKKHGYSVGLANANVRLGSLFMHQGRYDSAKFYLQKAMKIRQQQKDLLGVSHVSLLLGYIKREIGSLDSCIYYYLQSVRGFEAVEDSIALLSSYLELAHVYLDFNQIQKAKSYYLKSYSIAQTQGEAIDLANSQSGLGKFYFEIENYDSSLYYYSLAVDSYMKNEDWVHIATNYNNIASCLIQLNKYDLAINYYYQVIETYKQLNLDLELSYTYYNLGWVYYDKISYDSSLYFFNKSKAIAEVQGDLEHISDCYEAISAVYAEEGNFMLAYQNHLEFSDLRDSVLNEERLNSIAKMQTIYETEKKEQEIQLLNSEAKAQRAERNVIIALALALLLGLILISIYFIQRNRIARKNEQIAKQKLEATLDEQEIKTFNAVIEGQEEERMRIARDLHDRLGSMLSTVKLLFSALEEKIDRNQEKNQEQYTKANSLLDEACVEIRRISHNLGSGMVANFGLERAVAELCESIDQSGQISCKASSFGMENKLKLDIEIGIYRMIQEAVNNAIKHANAQSIEVQLNQTEDEVIIMVEDNGKGFNYREADLKEGMGLGNIKNRAEKLGGTFNVDSAVGRGSTLVIEIPLKNENDTNSHS